MNRSGSVQTRMERNETGTAQIALHCALRWFRMVQKGKRVIG